MPEQENQSNGHGNIDDRMRRPHRRRGMGTPRSNAIAAIVIGFLFFIIGPIYALVQPSLPSTIMPTSSCQNPPRVDNAKSISVTYETHGFFYPSVSYQPGAESDPAGVTTLMNAEKTFTKSFAFIPNESCTQLVLWVRDEGSVECTIRINGAVIAHEEGNGVPNKGIAGVALCTARIG